MIPMILLLSDKHNVWAYRQAVQRVQLLLLQQTLFQIENIKLQPNKQIQIPILPLANQVESKYRLIRLDQQDQHHSPLQELLKREQISLGQHLLTLLELLVISYIVTVFKLLHLQEHHILILDLRQGWPMVILYDQGM